MATLTASELARAREKMARQYDPSWSKPQINAAVQAIEDLLEEATVQNLIGSRIETAAPGKFNAAQKRRIFLLVCGTKAINAGVL